MARILVVDDSPTETYKIGGILGRHGYEVITAESAEAGIRAARDNSPDLVLMDIVMPGMNGFQATRQLTKDPQTSTIPVVILSNKGQEIDRVWGKRQGARGYLVKPVDEALLIATIKQVLADVGG